MMIVGVVGAVFDLHMQQVIGRLIRVCRRCRGGKGACPGAKDGAQTPARYNNKKNDWPGAPRLTPYDLRLFLNCCSTYPRMP